MCDQLRITKTVPEQGGIFSNKGKCSKNSEIGLPIPAQASAVKQQRKKNAVKQIKTCSNIDRKQAYNTTNKTRYFRHVSRIEPIFNDIFSLCNSIRL